MNVKSAVLITALAAFIISLSAGSHYIQFIFSIIVFTIIGLKDWHALIEFGSFKFWFYLVIFVAISPLFIGIKDTTLLDTAYSYSQLKTGAGFLLHAYSFVVLGAFLSRNFSIKEIVTFAQRIGMTTLGLRIALAMSAAKILKHTITETYKTYRLTRQGFFSAFKELHILFGAIIRNSAIIAERISILFYLRNIQI